MEERRGFGRGGFRNRGPGIPPKPVEVGKEYEIDIQEMSRRGEGVTRIQGLVIFVPNAKTGEHLNIKITRISRRFAEAEVVAKTPPAETEKKEE
jgi:predicted RNA-binding protein with TRAM domain